MLTDEPLLLTVEEVAALMRTTPLALRRKVERGTVPSECVVPNQRPRLFYAAKVREWLGLDLPTAPE